MTFDIFIYLIKGLGEDKNDIGRIIFSLLIYYIERGKRKRVERRGGEDEERAKKIRSIKFFCSFFFRNDNFTDYFSVLLIKFLYYYYLCYQLNYSYQ